MTEQKDERIIRLSCTKGCKVPSGVQYSNTDHMWTITQEIPIPDIVSGQKFTEEETKFQLAWMEDLLKRRVEETFTEWENFATRQDPPERHYKVFDGVKIPRVTAIITPDKPSIPFIDDYAELGTKLDEVMKLYVDTGEIVWSEFKDKGNIKETWEGLFKTLVDWSKVHLINYQFKCHSIPVLNAEHTYCGELDAVAEDNLRQLCIVDFKKTKKLTKELSDKYFMQMSAYAKACGQPIAKMVVLSPYNDPLESPEIDRYFEMFLEKRKAYKKRYGI